MSINFEYKNMSFEKVGDVWIHKDWALPGDFGDVFEKPASSELAERVELAYQVYCLEKKLLQKEAPTMTKPVKGQEKKKVSKKDLTDLDLTKPLKENNVTPFVNKAKKTTMRGSFNPFKQDLKQ